MSKDSNFHLHRMRRLPLLAYVAGTMIEWFDFMVFAYLSPTLAPLFFPQSDRLSALLETYVLFALGFLIRPVGGVVIGRWGDLYGRRKVLTLSVLLLCAPMLLTALLPTYREIGFAAPLLLGLGRLMVGFSLGGEWSGTVVALFESTDSGRRGPTMNLAFLGNGLGLLLASSLIALLNLFLTPQQMASWGWRIPFFTGGLLALTALALRRILVETPQFERLRREGALSRAPLTASLRHDWPRMLKTVFMIGYGSLLFYFYAVFLPGYLSTTKLLSVQGTSVLSMALAVSCAVMPLGFGWLGDRVGRHVVLSGALISSTASVWSLIASVTAQSTIGICASCIAICLSESAFSSAVVTVSAESFPTAYRFTALAVSFNMGGLLFGGPTPALCTALVARWGLSAPAVYISLFSLLLLMVLFNQPPASERPAPLV